MKLKHSLIFSLLALGLVTARAQELKLNLPGSKADQPAPAAPAAPAFTEAQLIEEFGWFIGKRVGLSELEFGKAEMDSLLKGMNLAAANKDSPYELEKIGPLMDEFMMKKQAIFTDKMKKKSAAESAAYFAKLKENKNVVELPSGLRYEIVKAGAGDFPKPTETVRVHYTGTLVDGTVFDSSIQRNEPAEFALNEVIPGWTEGIQKVNKGGKIKLYVPANLAYGDDGRQGIPPGSTLVFDVELLDIKPAAPAMPMNMLPGMPGMPGMPGSAAPAGK
jgi:FKBP-type peptidyl-prolyl cis-trans isomerase